MDDTTGHWEYEWNFFSLKLTTTFVELKQCMNKQVSDRLRWASSLSLEIAAFYFFPESRFGRYLVFSSGNFWNTFLYFFWIDVLWYNSYSISLYTYIYKMYMIDSDLDSNRHPLTLLSQITVRFKGILKSVSFPNSQIYGRFIG